MLAWLTKVEFRCVDNLHEVPGLSYLSKTPSNFQPFHPLALAASLVVYPYIEQMIHLLLALKIKGQQLADINGIKFMQNSR